MKWINTTKSRSDKREHAEIERLAKWHRKFAWWPVTVGRDTTTWAPVKIWLKFVERKRTYIPTGFIDNILMHSFNYDDYREVS